MLNLKNKISKILLLTLSTLIILGLVYIGYDTLKGGKENTSQSETNKIDYTKNIKLDVKFGYLFDKPESDVRNADITIENDTNKDIKKITLKIETYNESGDVVDSLDEIYTDIKAGASLNKHKVLSRKSSTSIKGKIVDVEYADSNNK